MDTTSLIVDEMRPAAAYVLGYENRMREEEHAGRTWELRSLERILDGLDGIEPFPHMDRGELVFDQEATK